MLTNKQGVLWATLAGGAGAAAAVWAWRRGRGRQQSAERLAAATLETLLYAVDANDAVTGRHMRRTASYALCLASGLRLPEVDRRKIERVALFHDIGKLHAALFDIVHDANTLSPEERAQIATHPERGAEVLTPLTAFYPELPAGVVAHHERWDGSGYPRRLQGAAIPFAARVVAIADTFDAITHSRRYHGAEGTDRGRRAIAEGRGTQFDPRLVDVFLSPEVWRGVERTWERSRSGRPVDRRVGRARPENSDGGDRRTEAPESSVPDVRFRWRAKSPVAEGQAADAPDAASGAG